MQLQRWATVAWYLRGKRERKLAGVQLDVTSKCNLRCKTCYFFKDECSETKNLSFDEIEKLLRRYRYEENIYQAWLFGGEPTLRPDVIDLTYRLFPVATVISNGQIKISPNYKRLRLHVSLDGLETENDAIRGAGTFAKVVDNYAGDKRVVFNVTLTKLNVNSLESIITQIKDLKTLGLSFQVYSPSAVRTELDDQLELSEEEYAFAEQILQRYHYDPRVFVTKGLLHSWRHTPLTQGCALQKYIYCYASDGSTKYCCTPGVECSTCKMLPNHLLESIERGYDWMTPVKFALWM